MCSQTVKWPTEINTGQGIQHGCPHITLDAHTLVQRLATTLSPSCPPVLAAKSSSIIVPPCKAVLTVAVEWSLVPASAVFKIVGPSATKSGHGWRFKY